MDNRPGAGVDQAPGCFWHMPRLTATESREKVGKCYVLPVRTIADTFMMQNYKTYNFKLTRIDRSFN